LSRRLPFFWFFLPSCFLLSFLSFLLSRLSWRGCLSCFLWSFLERDLERLDEEELEEELLEDDEELLELQLELLELDEEELELEDRFQWR
jgi:hypothetical protein